MFARQAIFSRFMEEKMVRVKPIPREELQKPRTFERFDEERGLGGMGIGGLLGD
jgi:hypothetical protein